MIRLSKLAAAAALATLSTLALAADPIKIGVSGPFTGGSSSMGVSMRDGVRLAVEEINKSGGLLGRQLVAVERDDEAKNERGVQIAQELINKERSSRPSATSTPASRSPRSASSRKRRSR
jgi:branched-chain amino acid transport system substrate-binding protein